MKKIIQFLLCKNICHRLSAHLKARQMFHEPLAYSLLPEMTERRISNIVNKSGTLDDLSDGPLRLQCKIRIDPHIDDAF